MKTVVKLRRLGLAIGIALLLLSSLSLLVHAGSSPQILINEFYRGSTFGAAGDEWIELVLTEDLTAAELEGFYVGDSTSSTDLKYSAYQFTNMSSIASTFRKGTIIVVGGGGAVSDDVSYDPGSGDWTITLQATGSYLTGNGSGADLAATDVAYVDTSGTGDTISADGFAVNWDSIPGAFGGNADVTLSGVSNNTGAVLTSGVSGATTPANWNTGVVSGSLTSGQPNGGANTTWIESLRTPISISKQVVPSSSVDYHGDVTYTVVISNGTAVSDTNALFTDTLPISTTFGSWIEQPAGASQSGDEITWSGTLTNNTALTLSFSAAHTGDYGDVVHNTAEYSGSVVISATAAFTVPANMGDVTFVYHDLEDVVRIGETVYIAGDFNSWNASANPLSADIGMTVFSTTISSLAVGSYDYQYIVNAGSDQWDWLNTSNRTYTVSGDATVDDYRAVTVGWANLDSPATLETDIHTPTSNAYGQVYIQNVTNPVGVGRGVVAQVGYGDDTDPANWDWFPMTYDSDIGNNDLFGGAMTPTVSGIYSYTTRFDGNWGATNPNASWTFADLDGIPFSLDQTGVLTVNIGPRIEVSKTVEPESGLPIDGSGVVTYTINVKNSGDALAAGAALTDVLPGEVDLLTWVVSETTTLAASDVITWSGDVAIGELLTWTFSVDVSAGDSATTVVNTATIAFGGDLIEDTAAFVYEIVIPDGIIINELDADTAGTEADEFIELYDGGAGNTPLDGLVVVLFNGSDDQSYEPDSGSGLTAIDLDGYSTDANGYLLIGGAGITNADIVVTSSYWLQNGADAAAIYAADAADFPNDTPLTTDDLIDAIVYGTSDPDDAGLLPLLNAGQAQVDEGTWPGSETNSSQRCPNGAGGARNTGAYAQFPPSPGADNPCVLPPQADLELHKTVAPTNNPDEGDTITYTLELLNDAASTISATNVVVVDYMPDVSTEITYVNNTCGATVAGDTMTWTVSYILTNTSETCDLVVQIRAGTDGSSIVNYAEVFASDQDDPDSTPGNLSGSPAQDDEASSTIFVGTPAACGTAATLIHDIQGSGDVSPESGNIHTIEAVVVGDYQQTDDELSGFFVQEEDGDADGDAATSEGIFIYDDGFGVDVVAGNLVRVTGQVLEYNNLTELGSVTDVTICDAGQSVTPVSVSLPIADLGDWEHVEGMLINVPQELHVTENYNLGRYGQVHLSINDHLYNPTNVTTPGAAANALQELNDRSRVILDDANPDQNPDPITYPDPGLSALNTLRGNYTIPSLSGVMDQYDDEYLLQPVGVLNFVAVNPRTAVPDPVGGRLTVASFNVLNYFTTLDNAGAICGPSGNMDCRGADSASEFTRQRDKIISAIVALDAGVVGLIEIENNPTAAVQDLVDGLNAVVGAGAYDYVDTGVIGTDAIKVALIYRPGAVTPFGPFAVLDSSFDPAFVDTSNRPALAQTFEENGSGERFTVVVNHLKSKGSDCDALGDPDTGDGQGNCNQTRTDAMTVEIAWLAGDPTGSGDPDYIILGDLNSYALEDPIVAVENAGYTDLLELFVGADAYSYVFMGQAGYLDYALSNASLTAQVSGVTVWHINADEPSVLGYDEEYKSPGQVASLYDAGPYRASDHDPLIVGLDLYSVQPTPDLVISKDVTPGSNVPLGGVVTYTISIANNGAANASGVLITDELPSGVTFGGYVSNPGGTAQLPGPGGVITWEYPVDSGDSFTFVFSATANAGTLAYGDDVTNIAYFDSANGGSGSDDAMFSIAVSPSNLSGSTKTVEPAGDVNAGDYLTYTITLLNSGQTDVSVSLTDTLPSALLLFSGLDGGTALTWSGVVSAEDEVQLTLVAQANPGLAVVSSVSNTVSIDDGVNAAFDIYSPETTILASGYYYVYLPLILRGP